MSKVESRSRERLGMEPGVFDAWVIACARLLIREQCETICRQREALDLLRRDVRLADIPQDTEVTIMTADGELRNIRIGDMVGGGDD